MSWKTGRSGNLRPIDSDPIETVVEDTGPEVNAGFSLNTGGDQGCLTDCPQVGLRIWMTKGTRRLEQQIRSCKQAGFGDPFLDGADCDDERIFLKHDDQAIQVIVNGLIERELR